MRCLPSSLALAIAALFLASAAVAGDLVTIKDSEATNHIGEKVEVRGRVANVHTSRKGNTFINLGGAYPHQTFTGFVPAGSELSSDSVFLRSLKDKEIDITGMISLYKAKPQIKVRSKDQIKVLK